jgi:transcriptional regulator with XRE-family HTH domain
MTLREYLELHNLSLKAFGERAGLSPATVLRARDGICIPSRRSLRAITVATGGAVTVGDLVALCDTESKEEIS